MPNTVAKIAVSAATYSIDKPYDYLIGEDLAGAVVPGSRVLVPFGAGNRMSEGIVLSVCGRSDYEQLKSILKLLDESPVLTEDQLRLALFMRERFFCTVYDAVRVMLPAGLWFDSSGKRRVNDKTEQFARLIVSPEDAVAAAESKSRKARQQSAIIRMLVDFEELPVSDLLTFTGAGKLSLKAVCADGVAELFTKEIFRRPKEYLSDTKALPILNAEQQKAYDGLSELSAGGKAAAALLFGVTGSGKTSVYIHLIKQALDSGKTAMLLVPEIALTPQMLETFSSYFGDEVAVLHSCLSIAERYDEWKRVKCGRARLVIGTRSAVFAPLENLQTIIIDEEQEETYKSENIPRYNAIDIAKYRCAKSGALLLLGSATPDVVSRYNAQIGKYSFFRLNERFNDRELPQVKIVDMKRELRNGNGGDISEAMLQELGVNISRGEQSILFINRRGTNKLVTCVDCGFVYKCPHCSVSLTYHSSNNRMMCHYCGFSRRVDERCPKCGGTLSYIGTGTEHVEQQLHELFPEVEVLRMDTDTVSAAGSHEVLFDRFRRENIPIMVGTQMITKGLNFENVTLVGVISADQSLYSGDYRAGERTFSVITQVVGRSGRGAKPGRAVIQTFTPENETVCQAAKQDYDAFFASELLLRRLQNAPPYTDYISITASGIDEELTLKTIRYIADWLKAETLTRSDVSILGPAPLPVVKVKNRYRYRVNISCSADKSIRSLVSGIIIECNKDKRFRGITVYADNDPAE